MFNRTQSYCFQQMQYLNTEESILKMNRLGSDKKPFLFILSYDLKTNYVLPLDEINKEELRYDFSGKTSTKSFDNDIRVHKIDLQSYKDAFNIVQEHLREGNSFLTNLTLSSHIETHLSLENIFEATSAKYKIWLKDQFVCFSPEPFIDVSAEGTIATYPMKGTIDASLENAEIHLENNLKELYEHTTIVDLLRSDLSKVAEKVQVERFRYFEKIKKNDGSELIQMSSKISGTLPSSWAFSLGTWLFKLLPAGSISGAPKSQTLQIIQQAETNLHLAGNRGFYTGVFGLFDGKTLQSAVAIRYIENTPFGKVFKSGGGITHLSHAETEYDEIYQKVYLPIG